MSKMCQKSSKLSKKTRHEKSKGSSGVENESKTCKALRKWTKAKTSLVLDFRFESMFEKFLRIFSSKSTAPMWKSEIQNQHNFFISTSDR